jgi:hypothetical protein
VVCSKFGGGLGECGLEGLLVGWAPDSGEQAKECGHTRSSGRMPVQHITAPASGRLSRTIASLVDSNINTGRDIYLGRSPLRWV